jgi:hypothetical protein
MAIAVDSEEPHLGEQAAHGNGVPARNERVGRVADLQDGLVPAFHGPLHVSCPRLVRAATGAAVAALTSGSAASRVRQRPAPVCADTLASMSLALGTAGDRFQEAQDSSGSEVGPLRLRRPDRPGTMTARARRTRVIQPASASGTGKAGSCSPIKPSTGPGVTPTPKKPTATGPAVMWRRIIMATVPRDDSCTGEGKRNR